MEHPNEPEAGSSSTHARVALFTPISAPILRSIEPVQVARFLKERERYELEVQSKQTEMPSLLITPYTASVDRSLLKHLLFMGSFDEIAPDATVESLTNEQIKSYLDSLVQNKDAYEPARLREALAGLSFPVKITDPTARIMTYCADAFERLDAVGYGDFKSENPKHMIRLLLDRIRPPALKTAMEERLKVEAGLEKNVKLFITRLKNDAKACQVFGPPVTAPPVIPPRGGGRGRGRGGDGNRGGTTQPGGGSNSGEDPEKDKGVVCLYPPHREKGIKHRLKDCRACPEDEKPKLLKAFLEERKAAGGKKAQRVRRDSPPAPSRDNEESSIVFDAVFANKLRGKVCADNGADGNIMDTQTLRELEATGVEINAQRLDRPRVFEMAAALPNGERACLTCDNAVSIDTELKIRHGAALVLRNLNWLVTEQPVAEPLIGRPLLEALGLNTRELLAAAADRFAGSIDAERLLGTFAERGDGRVSRIMEGVFHADGGEDDMADDDAQGEWCDIGEETTQEWEDSLSDRLAQAKGNGMSGNGTIVLEKMLRKHREIVRVRYDGGPSARVRPMELRIVEGAHPVRAKPRRYPPEKRQFLRRYVAQLEKYGLIKKAVRTEWVSAPLIVPKKPPALYRMTLDIRAVNAVTVKMTWPMPHIDAIIQDVRGATVFAGIDFTSGYWQLPMHPDSQHLHAFMTPDGVMQPTRTTQGGCNSAANFQACVEPCFVELRDNLMAWLDDFALHHRTEEQLLQLLSRFLQLCSDNRLVISLPKSTFFTTKIKWCGRVIDAEGVTMDPANYSGIKDATQPINAAELCEYVHCIAWMSVSIPRFAERAAPLYATLEEAYKRTGRRTKKSIAKLPVAQLGWGEEQSGAFADLQEQLQNVVKTSHPDPQLRLCVHSDASEHFWAVAVTQCPDEELRKQITKQNHQPLAFLSGAFNEAQEHWSTYEKEAFAVVQAFRRLNYLLGCAARVTVFTDHRNLLFAFHPTVVEPSLGRHKVLKVIRWALYLSAFAYDIEHVPGDLNTMADIMTRWMRGYRRATPTTKRVGRIQQSESVPTVPRDNTSWPTLEGIASAQQLVQTKPKNATTDDDGLLRIEGKVWVPDTDDGLKLKLLTVAHAGQAGHRGGEATAATLREEFIWKGLTTDARDFVSNCLLCMLSRSGAKIPRPLSNTLHASKPNEVLHFDYLYLGDSQDDKRYVLVLKDDFSGYAWLSATDSATAAHAAEVLSRWNRTFTAPAYWISDQGSHFMNVLLETMARDYNIRHMPTVAYSPWVNGTVERLNRDILAALRALLGELKLAPQDWTAIIDVIPSILNEAPEERLGKNQDGSVRSALQVMTGIRPRRALLQVMPGRILSDAEEISISRGDAERLAQVENLQTDLHEMHRDVSERINARRKRAIDAHNAATNIIVPSFVVGDYVIVCKPTKREHKLAFRWCGPRRVVAVTSPAVCVVEDLVTGRNEKVHTSRLKKYNALFDGEEVPEEVLDLASRTAAKYEVVEQIVDIDENNDGFWLRLQWEGLPDERDYTWSNLNDMYEDIPEMVAEYLRTTTKKKMASAASKHLGITA